MTYDERLDGIRSYDLAIKVARQKILEPTEEKLWAAIKVLRGHGIQVTHVDGHGIAAVWNVGPLKSIGYYEVLRRATGSKISAGKQGAKQSS